MIPASIDRHSCHYFQKFLGRHFLVWLRWAVSFDTTHATNAACASASGVKSKLKGYFKFWRESIHGILLNMNNVIVFGQFPELLVWSSPSLVKSVFTNHRVFFVCILYCLFCDLPITEGIIGMKKVSIIFKFENYIYIHTHTHTYTIVWIKNYFFLKLLQKLIFLYKHLPYCYSCKYVPPPNKKSKSWG
jgi:hypothetical protein